MKPLMAALLLLVGLATGWAVATWDSTPPEVLWIDPPEIVGPMSKLQVEIRDQGRGLKSLRLRLRQQGRERVVHEESFDEAGFLWTDGTLERRLELRPSDLAPREELKEGSFTLETQVQDHASLGLWSRETIDEQTFHLDRTPSSNRGSLQPALYPAGWIRRRPLQIVRAGRFQWHPGGRPDLRGLPRTFERRRRIHLSFRPGTRSGQRNPHDGMGPGRGR